MSASATPRRRTGLYVAFALFVLLGLPEGVLGTAWPSIGASLDRPVSSLAWLVGGYTLGYFGSTVGAGRAQEHIGVGPTLVLGVGATSVGLALYAAAVVWPMAVLAALVMGTGGGTVDAALNAHVARSHGPRAMNMLHAMFGVGATAGPILVTVALTADMSWRWVYGALLLAESVFLVIVIARRDQFDAPVEPNDSRAAGGPIDWRVLGPMLAVFVLYVSIEASFGQWSYSVLTERRAVSDVIAGWFVAAYWGGLTIGRLGLGVVGARFRPEALLASSCLGIVVGSVAFWWDPVPAADLLALPVLGLACAAVFPALVLLTPVWVGVEHTGRAVGYQLAASSAGVIVVSALIGVLVRQRDLDVVAPVLALLAVLLVFMNAITGRIAATRARSTPATVGG